MAGASKGARIAASSSGTARGRSAASRRGGSRKQQPRAQLAGASKQAYAAAGGGRATEGAARLAPQSQRLRERRLCRASPAGRGRWRAHRRGRQHTHGSGATSAAKRPRQAATARPRSRASKHGSGQGVGGWVKIWCVCGMPTRDRVSATASTAQRRATMLAGPPCARAQPSWVARSRETDERVREAREKTFSLETRRSVRL